MSDRSKRTYNLSPETIRAVRELADEYRVAASQDGVVELAVAELRRQVEDAREAATWAEAARDPAFGAEVADVEEAWRQADLETWPA